MTVNDLIQQKDYDYIEWRITLPKHYKEGDIFFGCTKSKNGELISLDGDIYSKDVEVLQYEEWSNLKNNVSNGLTVLIQGEWICSKN